MSLLSLFFSSRFFGIEIFSFLPFTSVFNNSVTEPSLEQKHVHATLHVLIRKTKKIWRLKWDIICKRYLPRDLLTTREWNSSRSMKASDMANRNGRRMKMVGKMFPKHHWSPSIVYTWENIDFFVAIWIIIRHLVRCGIVEVALSCKLASETLFDSRAVPLFQNGCWNGQMAKRRRKPSKIVQSGKQDLFVKRRVTRLISKPRVSMWKKSWLKGSKIVQKGG